MTTDQRNAERRREMGVSGALSQDHHAALNARYPGLTRQHCILCDAETGRCEEDGIYCREGKGPFCEACRDESPDAFEA